VSTLSVRSFRSVMIDTVALIVALLCGGLALAYDWGGVLFYICLISGAVFIGLLPIVILNMIKICNGRESVGIGELNYTHLILNTYKEASNTLYIPIEKIRSIELRENQKKYGDVIISIDGRNKPITVYKLLSPQKLIDIHNRLIKSDEEANIMQII